MVRLLWLADGLNSWPARTSVTVIVSDAMCLCVALWACSAVVFGIITSTFGALRDKRTAIDTDMHSTCFICSQSRQTIETTGESFDLHVTGHHNVRLFPCGPSRCLCLATVSRSTCVQHVVCDPIMVSPHLRQPVA